MTTALILDHTKPSSTDHNNTPSNPRRLPSSQYKGVVPQPNGRWGAQIYERHSRVWLGTFDSESAAGKAYDAAAQRFRGRDAATNFRPLSDSDPSDFHQLQFLRSHSKSEIVDMLRKHTYNDELNAFVISSVNSVSTAKTAVSTVSTVSTVAGITNNVPCYEHLFDKTVTPSDVGKLNRLVVPKQYAEKHFPLSTSTNTGTGETVDSQNKGLLLSFEDKGGKVWRFRYSYWNSSQSYVLTKGWSRFVKEKGLRAGDLISFHRMVGSDENRLFIDWKLRSRVNNAFIDQSPVKGAIRLFGVNLIMSGDVVPMGTKRAESGVVGDPGYGLKRSRGLENDSMVTKKQCVEA